MTPRLASLPFRTLQNLLVPPHDAVPRRQNVLRCLFTSVVATRRGRLVFSAYFHAHNDDRPPKYRRGILVSIGIYCYWPSDFTHQVTFRVSLIIFFCGLPHIAADLTIPAHVVSDSPWRRGQPRLARNRPRPLTIFWHADNAKLAEVQDFLVSNISGTEERGEKRPSLVML